MSNTALQGTDGGMIGGSTAAGASPEMPLDPDNSNPHQAAELVRTAGRMNTYDMHMLAHKFRLDLIKWTPTQLPGTILGNWKNHPNIHPFTRLIADHYMYWAGGFKLTFTICGSGLVGGRLRFIRVPPHISDEQIRQYSVNDLSYFDGFDLDPKSLLTISIPFEDINRQRMHVMTDDLTSSDAFGSRILAIVYGQLQAQIGDNNGLSVIVEVEMCEDFVISTFVPRMLNTPVHDFSNLNFGGNLTFGDRSVLSIETYPGTQRVVTTGFAQLKKVGGELHWPDTENVLSFTRYIDQPTIAENLVRFVNTPKMVGLNGNTRGVPGSWVGIWKDNTDTGPRQHYTSFAVTTPGNFPVETAVNHIPAGTDTQAIVSFYAPMDDEGLQFAPLNNERIMYFAPRIYYPDDANQKTSSYTKYPALQCREFGYKIAESPPLEPQSSLMFSVHDAASGLTILYAKLYPEGIFTTNPGSDALILPANLQFRFLSYGQRTDIIPALTPAMRADLRAVLKETKRSIRNLDQN